MYDTVIIGAGIAGDTAAIYAARKKMDFLLIASEVGGQFYSSGEITNYPGIIRTTGTEMNERFEKQLEANDIKPRAGERVERIEKEDKAFKIVTDKDSYSTRAVIIATGSRPDKMDVPGEKEFANKGITYCSVCDGPLFRDKKVVIAGGGNSALEAVDFMKDIASEITVVNDAEQLKAHEYLQENAKSLDKVEILNSSRITKIEGDDLVRSVSIEHDGEESEIEAEGVIIEIGRAPNTEFVRGLVDLDENGHIRIDCAGRTSVEGIFAAGDCTSGREFQYVIAAGQGCMALLKVARYLLKVK
jgi:thioredoxin-disulfide reductase